MGDEAGSAAKKGVVTSVNRGKVYFISWSMDVKVEGKNVVRHLDMTTHNHASPISNTGPWPYADSSVVGPGGDCHEESKKIKESGKCSDPVHEDTSPECCKVPERRCVMVAFKNDDKHCCEGSTTGHHAIPVQEFCKSGKPRGRVMDRLKELEPPVTYDQNLAPTICTEGQRHSEWEDTPPYQLKQHGQMGNAYKAEMIKRELYGKKEVKYTDIRDCGAASVHTVYPQCTEKCIKKQCDTYHCDKAKIPKEDPVCRSSQQDTCKTHDPSKAAPA